MISKTNLKARKSQESKVTRLSKCKTSESETSGDVLLNNSKSQENKAPLMTDEAMRKKIFVGGVQNSISEEDLKVHFSQFGYLTEVKLLISPKTKKRRGFGFVSFESALDYANALANRFHTICGLTVECKPANPRIKDQEPKTQEVSRSVNKPSKFPVDVKTTVRGKYVFEERLALLAKHQLKNDYLSYFFEFDRYCGYKLVNRSRCNESEVKRLLGHN